MLGRVSLASMFVLAMVAPALADANSCYEPIAPAALSGSTATEAQLKTNLAEVKGFIKDSDDYQTCLLSDLAAQKREAKKGKDPKPLDPAIEFDVKARIDRNQKLKEQVGNEYNTAVHAYQEAHPAPAAAH